MIRERNGDTNPARIAIGAYIGAVATIARSFSDTVSGK